MVEQANNIGLRGEDAFECARRDAFAEPTQVATQHVVAGCVASDRALVAIPNGANFGYLKTFLHARSLLLKRW